MAITVVIVTHRGGALLQRCVDALGAQTLAPGRVRVVVSSAGPVAPPRRPEGATWEPETLYQGCNVGFARAANAGLRGLDQPALLLNDDTTPEPGMLAALQAALDRHGPGIYQPCILLQDGDGRLDNLGHHLFPDGFNLAIGRGGTAIPAADEVGAFSGAAVLLSPEVLAAVGLFDEDLGAFGEDVDLSLRAIRLGFHIHAVPGARVAHALGATYGRVNPHKIFLVERNRARLALRSLPLAAVLALPLTTPLRLGALAAATLTGRGPASGAGLSGVLATLAGELAGLRHAPDALRKRHADARSWRLGERAMLRHLVGHRVRLSDLGGHP